MGSDTWHGIHLSQMRETIQQEEKRQQAFQLAKAANHVEHALTTVHSIN